MQKLIDTPKNLHWADTEKYKIEVYFSDEQPDISLCTSAYSIVFKDSLLLQTELKEGERPTRMLDIPGGHIDAGEAPEAAAIRETYEETGVHVQNPKLMAYIKVTNLFPKPDIFKYPYPVSFMLYYACDIESEEEFNGNEDAHGRVWLPYNEFEKSIWCKENSILLEEVMKSISQK